MILMLFKHWAATSLLGVVHISKIPIFLPLPLTACKKICNKSQQTLKQCIIEIITTYLHLFINLDDIPQQVTESK